MTVRRINPPELAPPVGFSHAVVAEGSTIVLLAGQTALNGEGRIVGATIVEQFEKVLGNLLSALAAAGGTPDQLAKLTIFSVDPADYRANAREIGAVWQRMVGRDYPAMTLVGVTRLWDDEALLEIEGTAILP
ncbi:MAG: RidA family protein [Candidatus Nanopelagicales bacterium]|jgi:enamine deaminase RidA (YjgF/YER057c/UK114 family)